MQDRGGSKKMAYPGIDIGYDNAAAAPYAWNGYTFPAVSILNDKPWTTKRNEKGAICGGTYKATSIDIGAWSRFTGTGAWEGGPSWLSASRQCYIFSENDNPICIVPYRVHTNKTVNTTGWTHPGLINEYGGDTYNYIILSATNSTANYYQRLKFEKGDSSRTYYYSSSTIDRYGSNSGINSWPKIRKKLNTEPTQQTQSHPYDNMYLVLDQINNENTSFTGNWNGWECQFRDYANIGEIMQELLAFNSEFDNKIPERQLFYTYQMCDQLPNWYEFIHFDASIPIFVNPRDAIEYLITGNLDNAANKDFIELSNLDWSTDWKLYVKGKSPSIKLVWESKALEDWINNPEKNTTNITLNDILVNIYTLRREHDSGEISQNKELLKYFPYTDSYYTTSYAELAVFQDQTAWDEFLSQIIGSLLGIGDVYLLFRIYYTKMWSTMCYCAFPYNSKPTQYGQWPNDKSRPEDKSTVTIIYGSDGSEDDGYIDREDPSDDKITGNGEGDGTGGGETGAGTSGLVNRTYAMSVTQIKQIASFLWSSNFFDNIKLVNNSPIENIISCKMFPTSLSGETEIISLGNVETGVEGGKREDSKRINVGSCTIPKLYNNFLDFAPYTKATIFLPFIGFKPLDLNQVMGKTLKIDYVFDLITGAVKSLLFSDNIYVQSYDGNAGLDIPITSSNRAQIEAGYITGALGVVAEIASGDIAGATMKGLGTAMSQYHYQTQGSYSPNCAWYETRKCYIIMDRPTSQTPSTYAHNIGFPCELSFNLGNLSGFTIVEQGIDLSGIPCTETERKEILSLLTSGIFL